VIFSPADDDILNMSVLPTEELIGKTLVLRGTRRENGHEVPFEFTYTEPIVVELELDLNLDPSRSQSQVLVEEGLTPEIAAAIETNRVEDVVKAFSKSVSIFKENR
jgi:hypothetical protein